MNSYIVRKENMQYSERAKDYVYFHGGQFLSSRNAYHFHVGVGNGSHVINCGYLLEDIVFDQVYRQLYFSNAVNIIYSEYFYKNAGPWGFFQGRSIVTSKT